MAFRLYGRCSPRIPKTLNRELANGAPVLPRRIFPTWHAGPHHLLRAFSLDQASVRGSVSATGPPLARPFSWSGLYVGANGGGGFSQYSWCTDAFIPAGFLTPACGDGPATTHAASGWLAGGQVGGRWQTDNWVFG